MIPNRSMWRYATLVFRLFLAVVFLVAGGSKVTQPWVFVHIVEGYNMLPNILSRPFGLALPWIEVVLGLYLLVGLFTRVVAAAALALLVVFVVALGLQIARGNTAAGCGCVVGMQTNPLVTMFVGGNTIGIWDLVRDGILALLALAIAVTPHPWLAVDALLAARREEAADGYEYASNS